jgi:hypothetical protein
MVKPAVYASLFLALGVFLLGTQLAYAKKTQWCIIDKKSGDYTSDCFKTREECQKKAEKKGSAFSCGVSYGG